MSPDMANVPHRHHAACSHPTVCPPALRPATSKVVKPADGRAQLAEKALGAVGVEVIYSNHSGRAVRRRVVSGCCSGAAEEASCEAAPSGRPAHVGHTASSAGSL